MVETDKFYKQLILQNFKFSTDSRNIESGDIFFALKGENFNGNRFARQALDKGASHVVVDEDIGEGMDTRISRVPNVLDFFQQLANFHRLCFDIPLIAVAGSNGKTTTKNLITAVLSKKYRTHSTSGNFNNHIGVPITLLQMPQNTEIAIIELGTNNPGEIAALCKITEPNYGLITNIGKEHLEGFGSLEKIAKEESELYRYIHENGGTVFVNEEDEWLMRMSKSIGERVCFGRGLVKVYSLLPHIEFEYKQIRIKSNLMGDYNLDNILTAICIGEQFGVAEKEIAAAIEEYIPSHNRSQMIPKGNNLIWLDAYNANPSSMMKAIENFAAMDFKDKVLILGDMFEMGVHSLDEHHALLQSLRDKSFIAIYLLGKDFAAVASKSNLYTHPDMASLQESIKSKHYQNTAFLIKGSRGMRMEEVLNVFD